MNMKFEPILKKKRYLEYIKFVNESILGEVFIRWKYINWLFKCLLNEKRRIIILITILYQSRDNIIIYVLCSKKIFRAWSLQYYFLKINS